MFASVLPGCGGLTIRRPSTAPSKGRRQQRAPCAASSPDRHAEDCPQSRRLPCRRSLLAAMAFAPVAASAADLVTYTGAADAPTPVSCYVPKEKIKMGKMDLLGPNFTSDSTCTFGGFTVDVPYTFDCPDYFLPLSGFAGGGPDPTGQLDARLEDPRTSALIVVSNAQRPGVIDSAANRTIPWLDKQSIDQAGTPEEILANLGPKLPRDLLRCSAETRGGEVYYLWELRNEYGKYNNRRLLVAAVRSGRMVLLTCVGSEKYWGDLEPVFQQAVASFKLL